MTSQPPCDAEARAELPTRAPQLLSVKVLLKFVVGVVLLYYVFVHSGMVDLPLLLSVLGDPLAFLICVPFFVLSTLACAARWRLLLRAQAFPVSYRQVVEITLVGYFFRTFVPWAIGADLLKAWYIPAHGMLAQGRLVATILVDRALGLAVILGCSAMALPFFTVRPEDSGQLAFLKGSVWGLTWATIGVLALWSLGARRALPKSTSWLARFERKVSVICSLLYRRHPGTFVRALLWSALSVGSTISIYAIQGALLGIHLPLRSYFLIVPLGILASAVPLLPNGIGVGQIAYYNLFLLSGTVDPQEGATLCTLLQCYTLLFNLSGGVCYLRAKRVAQ